MSLQTVPGLSQPLEVRVYIPYKASQTENGCADGHVRIWSTDAIYNAGDPNYSKPRQLASMSYHSGTIHTVRFSSSGKFLASGADDKIVCVYTLDPNPPSHSAAFGTYSPRHRDECDWIADGCTDSGTNESPPAENWRIFRRLIGHENDVQDLGWSYDSSILVSVSLDSKVVVWSGHTFEKLKTLANHQSHVKGLTFDPANKYFATASDDRTIKIWRFTSPGANASAHDQANNFVLEKTIAAPFVASPLTTYFRRCSWSPDGNHIAAANAVNGPVSSVAIINRGSWDGDIHLIGHEGPVEVCAFSPRLFSKQPLGKGPVDSKAPHTPHLVTVIACAGQDKALSVWITSNPRPLVITQDLAIKSISDLAWTPDGKTLFVTSLDGTILAMAFETSELGYEVSLEENEKSLARFGAGRRGAGIIEGTTGLILEERSREGELRGAEGRMGALMGDSTSQSALTNGNGTLVPTAGNLTNGVSGPQGLRNGQEAEQNAVPIGGIPSRPAQDIDPNAAKLERLKQRVTITKDGKKRIAPLLVSSSVAQESSLPRTQLMASTSNGQGAQNNQPQTVLDLSKPFDGLPRGGLSALLLGNKRRFATVEGAEDGHIERRIGLSSKDGSVPILANTVDGLIPAQLTAGSAIQPIKPGFIRPAVTNPSLMLSQLRLAVPRVRSHIVQTFGESTSKAAIDGQVNGSRDPDPTKPRATQAGVMIEARNPTQLPNTGRAQDSEPCRITVTKQGQPVWQDYLPRSVLLITGNRHFWSAACEDGSVYAWTPAGRRLVNALVLESQPVILECQDQWLLCVTAVGMCYVWDIKTSSSPHPPVSLAPILDIAVHNLQEHVTHAPAVTSAHINSEGRIVVTLSNGDGYAYSSSMYVWQRLSELWWAVGSQYWNTTDSSVGNLKSSAAETGATLSRSSVSAGIIPFLERRTTHETLVRGRAGFLQRLVKQLLSREGFEGFESSVSVAHLENRLAATIMLGAKEDFQVYLYMYAKRLGAEGQKSKVGELLQSLLGSFYDADDESPGDDCSTAPRNAEDRSWDNTTDLLCGWQRKELLRGVILILGRRIYYLIGILS